MGDAPAIGPAAAAAVAAGEWVEVPTFPGGFNASFAGMQVRVEGDRVRVRQPIGPEHANQGGAIHGGLLMGVIDQSYFVASYARGLIPSGAVTMESSAQFLSAGKIGVPLDAVVEVIHETGRTLFLRGMLEQEAQRVASFSGILRKLGGSASR